MSHIELKHLTFEHLMLNTSEMIKKEMQHMYLPKGFGLTLKGSTVQYVYFFITGSVAIIRTLKTGKTLNSSILKKPYFIGDLEVVSGNGIAAATMVTTSRAKVIRIPANTFKKWFEIDDNLARSIAVIYTNKLWNTSYFQGEFMMLDTFSRFLVQLKNDYLSHCDGEKITRFKKTKKAYSLEIGCSIRTIAKKISLAKGEGLISRDDRWISISEVQYRAICSRLDDVL